MDVFQVEPRGFYVRLVSNKGVGVAASLYKALESLTSFIVQSSNLTSSSSSERLTLTFTLNVNQNIAVHDQIHLYPFFSFILFPILILLFALLKQIKGGERDMNLPNLRLWITGSLLNQGFELIQTAWVCSWYEIIDLCRSDNVQQYSNL